MIDNYKAGGGGRGCARGELHPSIMPPEEHSAIPLLVAGAWCDFGPGQSVTAQTKFGHISGISKGLWPLPAVCTQSL